MFDSFNGRASYSHDSVECGELHSSIVADGYAFEADAAMYKSCGVQRLNGAAQLQSGVPDGLRRKPPRVFLCIIGKACSAEVFRHGVHGSVFFKHIVDTHDVIVSNRCRGAHLRAIPRCRLRKFLLVLRPVRAYAH